jgi:atrophin-1 interacting protein 3 (BAI1-associated protein 1)
MNHLEIVKLIKESGNSITLTIGAPTIEDIQVSQANLNQSAPTLSVSSSYLMNSNNAMTSQNGIKPYFNMSCVSPNLNNSPKSKNQTIINQNEYHVIELRKHQSNGFGFSIRGGREFNIPLFVLKLADQGPAALDGRLQVGDQILEINGYDAYNMSHNEAIERIKSSGNIVTLLIRRTGQVMVF